MKIKHCTSRFFVFYTKQKMNLTWPNAFRTDSGKK